MQAIAARDPGGAGRRRLRDDLRRDDGALVRLGQACPRRAGGGDAGRETAISPSRSSGGARRGGARDGTPSRRAAGASRWRRRRPSARRRGTRSRALLVPLRVRDRGVGVLRLADDERWCLSARATLRGGAGLLRRAGRGARAAVGRGGARGGAARGRPAQGRAARRRSPTTCARRSPPSRRGARARAGRRRAGGSIEEEADRLNRFVSDLLDLSRLNSGAIALARSQRRGRPRRRRAAADGRGARRARDARSLRETSSWSAASTSRTRCASDQPGRERAKYSPVRTMDLSSRTRTGSWSSASPTGG